MTAPGSAPAAEAAGAQPDSASGVDVRGATKSFPTPEGSTVHALRGVDLQIGSGEFFVLLGPSGCGKTTLLRSIAGLEALDEGEIHLAGQRIDRLPPYRRPVNTVFQSYALFPHLTVAQNVAFGLEMDGVSRQEAQSRVAEMLELVHMPSYAARKPSQLSGGQQQRVALARALAKSPRVLLLDEPLAALDLKLRRGMQAELKSMQRTTGITFVFVTHDQEEALSMGDRIAVFDSGSVAQIGSPEDVYERPVDRFVADFIGETNFLQAPVERDGARHVVRVSGGPATVLPDDERARAALVGDTATLAIRPERITLRSVAAGAGADDVHLAQGSISSLVYMGTDVRCTVSLDDGTPLQVRVPPPFDSAVLTPGARVTVDVPTEFLRPVAAAAVAGEES